MNKARSGQFLWSIFALSLTALLAAAQLAPTGTAVELDRLQGNWEGEGAGGKCSITIAGHSLHYRAGSNWFETTFTLPPGTAPQQLHATIKDCKPPTNSVGTVVYAIYKIEDGTLTLSTYIPSDDPPKIFDGNNLYVVKKVQPQKKSRTT